MKIYRRGLWQIVNIILWTILIIALVGMIVVISIDFREDYETEMILGLVIVPILLIVVVYHFSSLFRSYIVLDENDVKVTANVKKINPLIYKDQNAFSLQYTQIQNISLAMHSPNPAKFFKGTPHYITMVLQTDNNNRYITLHYHSEKQICLIIDLLLDKIEQKTGNRISDKCGRELLDEFISNNKTKPKANK